MIQRGRLVQGISFQNRDEIEQRIESLSMGEFIRMQDGTLIYLSDVLSQKVKIIFNVKSITIPTIELSLGAETNVYSRGLYNCILNGEEILLNNSMVKPTIWQNGMKISPEEAGYRITIEQEEDKTLIEPLSYAKKGLILQYQSMWSSLLTYYHITNDSDDYKYKCKFIFEQK